MIFMATLFGLAVFLIMVYKANRTQERSETIIHSIKANNYALEYMIGSGALFTKLRDNNQLDSLDLIEMHRFCKYVDSSLYEMDFLTKK